MVKQVAFMAPFENAVFEIDIVDRDSIHQGFHYIT